MKMGKGRLHRDESVSSLSHGKSVAQFTEAHAFLKRYLVHTREILNGRDFLFLGPKPELHEALKLIIEIEHKSDRFLHVDFAQVDEYFLLRLVGSGTSLSVISEYFR